jgi:hypothetical protein
MYFEQVSPQVYSNLTSTGVLPSNHAYNSSTEQLVIWTKDTDRVLVKAVQLAQGLYEMCR